MKKFLSLFSCLCLICSLAATAFASYDISEYIDEYSRLVYEPVPENYGGICPDYMDAHDAWVAGLLNYAAEREQEKSLPAAEEPTSEAAPTKPTESAGASHALSSNHAGPPVDAGSDDKYPFSITVPDVMKQKQKRFLL